MAGRFFMNVVQSDLSVTFTMIPLVNLNHTLQTQTSKREVSKSQSLSGANRPSCVPHYLHVRCSATPLTAGPPSQKGLRNLLTNKIGNVFSLNPDFTRKKLRLNTKTSR